MNFEQIANTDRVNQVKELTQKSATLSVELKSAEQNVKALQYELAECNAEITFPTDQDNIVGIDYDAIRCLARKIPPESLLSLIVNEERQRELLEKNLKILEQAQEIQIGEIAKRNTKIRTYKEVYTNTEYT